MSARRGLLAGSAPICDPEFIRRELGRGRWLVIAANGGRRHLDALGIPPDVAIGDFDSAPARPRGAAARRELKYPREKDETDLELAFAHAFGPGRVEQVTVIGALGARFDHTLTNLNLGARWARRGFGVTFLDGTMRVRFATAARPLALARQSEFDTVSLIPHSAAVRGITTRGLAYPLVDDVLRRDRGRGVSNFLTGRQGEIRLGSGLLMVIETRA